VVGLTLRRARVREEVVHYSTWTSCRWACAGNLRETKVCAVEENRASDTAETLPATPTKRVPGQLKPLERGVLVVGAVVFAVLMALSPWYGFDRDELYFLDCARHLQGGYVDQPILVPLLARVSLSLFGLSLPGLRLWAALAAFATVIVGSLIARELGGNRRAQLLSAIAVATMPALLGVDHLEGPTALDVLAWATLALLAIRIGRTREPRWWLAAGFVLGLGLANKHSIGFFGLALVIGALLSGGHRLVVNRWFLGGALVAAVFTLPDLIWQAQHGWATITMTRQLNQENGGLGNVANWVVGQLIMTSLVLVWVWVVGLRSLWRSREPFQRGLAWAYGLLFVFFAATTGAKIYYLAGAYVYLLPAGIVDLDRWRSGRPKRARNLLAWTALSTALALPIVLPVLPASDTAWVYRINQVPGESVGWPELVHTVRTVWFSLPAKERTNAVVFAADYGETGAINELGRGTGLPTAVSAQNNDWWFGPGNPNASTIVAVAPGPRDVTHYADYLKQFFLTVRTVATFRDTAGIHNQEWGGHVYVCTGLRRPWNLTWPELRNYD